MPTTQINVTNASFEQTSHGDGGYSQGIPGWTITESGSGEAGDYDPSSSEIDLSTVDGENVAWLYSGDSGGSGVSISQTLSETYTAGRTYTLQVDVGDGSYGSGGDQPYTLNILAGSTVIGTVSGNTGDIDALQTVVLQSTVNNPALNGQPITIEIADPPGSGGGEFLVDNVQFFVSDPIDGIVEGTSGDDLIDQTYTDDPEGDVVNDTASPLAGTAPEDDSVQGGGGNDTILTGVGDDTIDAGTGADSVEGGSGDDTIEGGDAGDVLYGDLAGGSLGQDASPLVLDIDNVRPGSDTQNGDNNAQVGDSVIYDNVATLGDGTVVAARLVLTGTTNANLEIDLNDGAGSEILLNEADDSAMEGEQASFRLEFFDQATGNPLSLNATATFNDIDNASNGIEQVQLNAAFFSAFGTSQTTDISVSQTGGLVTATASDSSNASDQDHWFSAMFENQSSIEFTVTSRGGSSGYTLSGDLIDDADITPITPGNDSISGGTGDDTIFGGAGDDTLYGDAGADAMEGGDDADLFYGGAGDVIDGGEGGVDNDTLDLTGSALPGGSLNVSYDANPENGTVVYRDSDGNVTETLTFSNIENVVACFTPGTLIKTMRGEVDVSDLRVGDRVLTRDCGYKPIRWIGSCDLSGMDLFQNPQLWPVRIAAGALGDGCPERDMLVSPQHRVLIANHRTQLWFGEDEVLVPAVHLVGRDGITQERLETVTYIHFMFDQHEVVQSDGAWSESFQPGDWSLTGLGEAQRREILQLFPELATRDGRDAYRSARKALKRHEVSLLSA